MQIIKDIFTDQHFLGAMLATIVFIVLGYVLSRLGLIKEDGKKAISAIVMKIAIPCMAFAAFMSDFDPSTFWTNILIFVLELGLYVSLILLGNLFFLREEKSKRTVYAIIMALGQLTFFSIPLLKSIYVNNVSEVLIPASMMTLAFRIVLYFYAFISISGTKLSKETVGPTLKKIFLNPIMIMMLLGLIIWLTQNITWQIQVDEASYGFLRIDKTAPMLFKVIEFGDVMATPLCMILIGSTLGEAKFLDAIKNKTAWILALLHTFFVPLFVFGICCALEAFGWMHFSEFQLAALVIGMTAPVSAVVVVFTVQNDKESYVASDTLFLTTLLCLIAIPAMFALVKLAMTWPLFIA